MGTASDMREAPRGEVLWQPSEERARRANLTRYVEWLDRTKGVDAGSYDRLWRWSVSDLEGFWGSIWDWFDVPAHAPFREVLADRRMPGARWFPGAELNYAERALARRDGHPAIVFGSEAGVRRTMSHAELAGSVAAAAAGLRGLGVRSGDRVVAYLPNIPETVVAFLAVASLGAVWSSCPPDFGVRSVIDRFRQIEPKVLLAADGYRYNGRSFDRLPTVEAIRRELPTLAATVVVPYLEAGDDAPRVPDAISWQDLLVPDAGDPAFEPVPFDHPLWVLYSSGTTGLPKALVQGHGGILLEHLKALSLHLDLTAQDSFFWFTSTGWMMWNFLVGGLLLGASIVLFDGSPSHPDLGALWRFAEETGVTYFGTSAPFIQSCMKAGIRPAGMGLDSLRAVGSTGAPLSAEGFRWVYEHVRPGLELGSVSGGTDVCTAFVGSCPLLPVRAGEIQCRWLGCAVGAYDEEGREVVDRVGELVLTQPMPSMPLYLWGDPDATRYRESYFAVFPGVWRHGDWIRIDADGSCVIYGRSDSTLNRGGVRMGTSEFYRVVEDLPQIVDSLVVDTGELGREGRLLLFVVVAEGSELDDALRETIATRLRAELSPRHVPDEIVAVPEVPRTLNMKKLEVPVRRILLGTPVEKAVSLDALANPNSVRVFAEMATRAS